MEVQELEVGSWVTVRRGRGKSLKQASPELVHPNTYAKLRDVGGNGSGVAFLEQLPSPSCRKNDCLGKEGGKDTGKVKHILVAGDSIIRRIDRPICHNNHNC